MESSASDLRSEALLYLRWMRGAAGRFYDAGIPPRADSPEPAGVGGGGVMARDARRAGDERRASPSAAPPPSTSSPAPSSLVTTPRPTTPQPAGADPSATDEWDRLRREAEACRRCGLCESRTHVVFGEGSRRPRLMVIGEAPGADEDASGRPFVGRAGQLLTRMLAAIGLAREDVFIANLLKCRPPDNRPPAPDEAAACRPYLEEQLRLLDPELLLLLGNHAMKAVLGTDRGITALRGEIRETPAGRRAVPTFHPAYLLRNPAAKREAWIDLQLVAKTLGLVVPPRAPISEPAE